MSLSGFNSLVLPYYPNPIISVMQRSRATSTANVSHLITLGWRRAQPSRCVTLRAPPTSGNGTGSDNGTAAPLLLKGSFPAAAMPVCHQRPGRVGRQSGIECVRVCVCVWGGLFRIASAEAPPVSVGSGGREGTAAAHDAKLRSNSLACSCCGAALNSVPRPSGTTQILHKLSIHWR